MSKHEHEDDDKPNNVPLIIGAVIAVIAFTVYITAGLKVQASGGESLSTWQVYANVGFGTIIAGLGTVGLRIIYKQNAADKKTDKILTAAEDVSTKADETQSEVTILTELILNQKNIIAELSKKVDELSKQNAELKLQLIALQKATVSELTAEEREELETTITKLQLRLKK